jgi:hypothetical protein
MQAGDRHKGVCGRCAGHTEVTFLRQWEAAKAWLRLAVRPAFAVGKRYWE